MGWLFHASDPMGGAAGEAFANTLKSPGMRPEHVLAREAIQNSVDAGSGQKVEVRFRSASVPDEYVNAFIRSTITKQDSDKGRAALEASKREGRLLKYVWPA